MDFGDLNLEMILKFLLNGEINLKSFVKALKTINFTFFDDATLRKFKVDLKKILDSFAPRKLQIKTYRVLGFLCCLFFTVFAPIYPVKIASALLAFSSSIGIILPVFWFFKDKSCYENDEDINSLREMISDIDGILQFRKNRVIAVDLEEKHNNSINKDLEYLSKLIKLINSKVDLLSASDKIRFDRVLSNLNEIKSNEEIKEATEELESIVDVLVADLGVEVKEELNVDRGRHDASTCQVLTK